MAMLLAAWPRSGNIDARLVGKWEASPDAYEAFPIQLSSDGSAQLVDIWCGGRLSQSYRWTAESDELRLYAPAPWLSSFSVAEVSSFLRRSFSWVVGGSRKPIWRYRILERTAKALRLQTVGPAFMNHDEIHVFQRAVDD
jgi:hypothetical protein